MPFRLKNVRATYQRLVDKVFTSQIGRNMESYINDMEIKSMDEEDMLLDIKETFKRLRGISMKLNLKKCSFEMEEGQFLGHVVSKQGIKANPAMVQALMNLELQKTIKEVQSLNGLQSCARNLDFFESLTFEYAVIHRTQHVLITGASQSRQHDKSEPENPSRDGERRFDYLTSALVSLKAHREGCRASRGGFPYWLPIPSFICKVLNYFKVYISRFNPFGIVKMTTFVVLCKAYEGEPTVNLLRSFLNLGRAGDWITFLNKGSADIPIALVKPVTHLANWKCNFLYVEDKITPSDYPELLLDCNKFNKKSFGDKVPLHPELDPLYEQIAIYPCHVRTFPDPILYLAGLKTSWKHSPKEPVIYYRDQGMDFRSFVIQGIDGEFKFLPKGCIDDNQGSPSSKSVNNEAPVIDAKPLTSVHPSNFEDVDDFDDASAGDNENPLVGTSLPPLPGTCKKLRSLGKRKPPSRVGDSLLKVQKMAAQASKVADEASDPLDVDSDADIHEFPSAKELKDSADCHWVVAHVTPPSWKENLHQISIKQLCDIHDRAYMRQVNLDNLEKKCNEALLDLDKNPLVADMRAKIETLQARVDGLHSECTRLVLEEKKIERLKLSEVQLLQEIDALKQDRASVVARVVPDAAIKLIRSDEMGMLVAKLVKASIIYGRCAAFEEVAKLKEPFVMEKMTGYHPSSKQEYDQAGDDLANASYPFLSEYVNDPYASLEQLLSKKPESFRLKPLFVKAK
ncbi:hypothetical protein Tco_0836188 [Tanacetum coccineum]